MNARLIHDAAWAGSQAILDMTRHALREEEQRAAFNELYRVLTATLQAYEIQVRRQNSRITPGRN